MIVEIALGAAVVAVVPLVVVYALIVRPLVDKIERMRYVGFNTDPPPLPKSEAPAVRED